MTLTDLTRKKGPPEWVEEDQIVSAQGRVGEDIIVEVKLVPPENCDDLQFDLIRDGLPISSDRYRLSMRGNVVQLALKQSRKNDAGYYSLVATRLGQENDKGAVKKIHLSISEASYEEGDPPIFLRRLSDLAVKVGTRTRFLVEIRSSTTPKISWYKDDSPIHEGPRFSLVHEGNFHCVDVAPVTVEDQGCWTCMAENRSGRSSCTSTLTVIVPKAYKRPEFVEELRALLTETGTVSLECKVVGVPTPVLRWFKDSKEIKAGDVFALTANADDPTSLGVYTCEANNCMGTTYSSSKVHVVGRGSREGSLKPADTLAPSGPLPVFKQMLQDECCRIGDALVLSCRAQVPPWPKAIAWYNKGGRVEPDERYHIIEDGIGGYSIEVKQVEAMDEGEWKCVATSEENMKQFTSCYVAMSIPRNYRKPRFMENLKAVLTEEGLVSFECKVVGFPTPLLRWFKDGQELKPGDVYQLTGTNSLGSYCCIAKNCMGEAKSTAELTIEDIQNQLNEEERFQLLSTNQPPKFIKGLRSCEARINEDFRFTVQVSVAPEPSLSWYRDDALVDESDKYHGAKENLGTCHLEVRKLEFIDQAEWKCVAANDFGHSVTSCFLKLIIPKHFKKPKFLESLRAILSEEGAVNLECKVIGVPQPVLKWYKDNVELKPGDIHRIISGQDGTCCLGTYTCEATNCMGTVSSSASLLGFEDKKETKEIQSPNGHELARNLSLSTIHEERTSQLYDTPQTDHSITFDERGEVSFSFDGKEVSVSLYETPDLTEEEALQIVEMYADQLSEHVTEHNVIELPPMRFVKETSTSGNLLMEAIVIDVSPDYFVSAEEGDDLRTEADFEDVSIMDDVTHVLSSPDSRSSLKRSARYVDEEVPSRPPRKKSTSISSSKSEKSLRIESETFHSAQKDEAPLSPLSSLKQDDSDTFADALSSAHLSITESLVQKHITSEHDIADTRKRSLSTGRSTGSSLDDGISGDSSFDSMTGIPKKKQRKKKKKDKSNSEEYSGHSDYEDRKSGKSEDRADVKIKQYQSIESADAKEIDIGNGISQESIKKSFSEEKPLDNLTSVTEAVNVHTLEENRKLKKDILLESRMILRKTLETYEKVPDTLVPQFSNIRERVNDVCQTLEISQEKGMEIETLINLEVPLHALLKTIDKITSAEDMEIIRNFLEPSILQLSHVVEGLGLSSLQPTLAILRKINERICSIPIEKEELSSLKLISDETRNISEEILDMLIDIQSAFSAILDYMECSKLAMNGTAASQQALTGSRLAACLVELRECVSHTTHTAMTLKENETLNSLMEFREPLLDLQVILASDEYNFREITILKEIIFAIERLNNVVVTILENSKNSETTSRVKIILQILEDTDKQISKLMEQLLEMEAIQKHVLKNLNIDQSLSSVHFALSSVLEQQEKSASSHHLITSIETLRQTIGSSAVTIANLKNPTDNDITQEIIKLTDSLLNLQKTLLTEKHEPGEEQILNNLINPIDKLKEIIHSIMESNSSVDLIVPMLKLLEEIEKDAILVAKEISKKKSQEENATKSRKEKKGDSKSILACQISRSLEPMKQWLSTSEDSTKDEIESTLSLTIEELKRDVTQIAIQTSYSEPPDDESLIEALIDLREPLIKLKNAISMYHRPEDFLTLENLGQPMKHLLQIITNVFHEHAEEERLKSMIEIVEQIENEISLSIKDTLYQQELEQSVKTFNVEEKEEIITVSSQETIPGTLTEIASTPFETGSLALPTEQLIIEDNLKVTVDDIASQAMKAEKQKREENAGKLITVLSETLEKLQLEMTNILEDFEESTTQTATIPQSKLANFVEELRRTTSTIRMITTVYDKEIGSLEEKVNQTIVMLTNLTQPLTNIQELLSRPREHDILELMILNRLTPLLNVIEINVIKQTIDFVDKNEDTEKEFEFLLHVLQDIKAEIPIVIQEISSRQKTLECLRDISKPLDSIVERMNDLQKAAEGTLETDVANILGKPIAALLKDIKTAIQETGSLDRRGPIIIELRNLLEPLLEFDTCLSMVQSSRQSLVPEGYLLEEKRSVILQAVGDLRKQVCHTVETIANMEEASLFDESLMLLNSAIQQVQKQIGKTDYSCRSSSVKIPLQHRLTGTLSRLANALTAIEEHADRDTYGILSKCLEALHKQISFTQVQFIQIGNESIDEEAIVEGFLYPTNQLLSALNVLRENTQKVPSAISRNLIIQFQELANSISELNSSLTAHKDELVQEGASTGAPIIETFSAVTDVLSHVKDSIMAIEKTGEQKESITKIESITDEIIEISQEEIESVITITEIPSSAVQDVAQSKIEDTPKITQTPVIENVEAATRIEQTEDNLVDTKKYEENQEENEKQKYLTTEMSKFNSTISSLAQPLKELISFVKSATQESLASKSEENKRKIQELTALVQILYDLQATNISIKTALSSSIILIDSKFSRMKDNLADFEQAIGTVISLTDAGVKLELKENIMTSLQSIVEPLNALENTLVSICQTFDGDKYVDQNGKSLPIIAKDLIPCINDTIKSVNAIQVLKSVKIADERETEISKIKEEINDIEETTARPLEELIEAIMDSQDQVKCDKTSPYESSSPSADPIESKSIDNLSIEETELNETFIKEANDLVAQDTVEISQQELTSAPVFSQIEEILTEKKATIKSATESLEEVEEKNLETIKQQKIELTHVSEEDSTQEKQIKVETLHAIISPLQVLRESFDKIGDIGILESSDKKMIAFSTLIEPLLNLEVALPSEITEEIKQDTVSLEKLSIACVLQELQKSIATIQEQVQLNTATEASSSKTAKIRLLQAIEKPLEDLKMSIACIQSEPITCQLIQQKEELSSVKQIAILQTLAKSVEQFGEKFMSITNELKIEAESESPLQIIKQKDQELDPEILHKIVEPIHILRETLSQIEELKSHKTELLEISEQKKEVIQLNTVINPLEKLEQLLSTNIQQITPISMAQEKALSGNQVTLTSADLKPVLEELKDSIVIQQQAVSNEDSPTVKTLNETFENLNTPLTIIQEIIDCFDEITETEKLSTLLMFAKSVEETANQLVTAKQNIMQQEMRETSLLKAITLPIEGLQSAILKFEDRVSQTLETKESIKLVALESMVQPLQELQQSFLIASHQEIAQSLQRLPIKPVLDNLNKSVAVIQNQATIVQDLLAEASTDDLAILKDFAKSLGNLRTSTVVLQQLNAIENAGRQIVEIENASALQAFAKSIEEFRKCCSIVIEKPRIIEAFATSTIELKQSAKTDTQLLENIIAPLRILQEQILTIEETKTQESEVLDITEIKKPVTVLSSLVGPLQQLEKSFVATVCKEHVIEHDGQNLATESPSTSLEKLALQPILEEVQKSIATVQEHVILEAGSQIISEAETDALLKSIAQPLVDLKASIASIQQVTTVAPDPLNELAQQQNISALESFAETLHNLSECIAMCNHQQIIMEPVVDTFSEGASSLNTWADVIDEQSLSKVTQPMVIDQVAIESPIEVAISMSEDEASALKTLAKPLTELRECLALVVEERKIVAPSDTTSSLSERENVSLLKTMIQPLLELKDAVTAVIIQEQTVIERANEHSFAIDGKTEFALRPLMEPLEELRHSIAVIEDQMLVETSTDQPQNEIVLDALAEPLFDLQRAISVLEARVISPDVESLPEDTSNNWITECLAVPLHEIERSIADIRQCTIIEPEKISEKEEIETSIPWSIVEELSKPMENIKSAILRMEDDYNETEILKTMVQSLTNVQEKLMLLKNKHLSAVEESSIDAIVDSLFNLEKCISFVKKEIVDKPMSESSMEIDTTISAALNVPLNDLKYSIVTVKDSPSIYLKGLQRPLELVQDAFETIISIQQNKKLLDLSTKVTNVISNINTSIESIGHKLEEQQVSAIEICIECEALGMLTKPLQNIKQCITQIPEKPKETANLMISTLQNLEKSVAVIQQQSADKPLADPQYANFGILSKNLILCLHELQESMEEAKTLWHKQTILEGLIILEKPICKLQSIINIISDQFLAEEMIQIIEKQKIASEKKSAKKEVRKSETTIEKDDEINKTIKVEIEETKLTDTADSTVINDMADKEEKKSLEMKQKQEKEDEKSIKEKLEQPKDDIVKKGNEKEEEYKKIEKQQEYKKETDEMKSKNEEQKKEEIEKINKKQKSKEIEQVAKEAEQNEKSIKDERIKKDEKEHKVTQETESLKKHEDGEVKQIEKQEKVNATESIKDEIQESKKIIEPEEIKSEKNEQQNKENYEKINKMAEERKQEQETVQKRKESDKSKKTEKDLNVKEETEKIKVEEAKDIERKKVQAKEKEKAEEMKKEQELKNIKENEKVKEATEQYDKNDEIEKLQKKEKDEIDKTQQKEQEHVRIEKTEIVEKDHKIEVKEIKKQEEDKTIKKDGKEQEKEDEKAKRIKTEKLEKEEQIKKEEDEKLKDEKTKEMKKKKEDSNKKDEIVQEKIKKQEQTPEEVEAVKTQDQKEKEITEKVKEKEEKKAEDDVKELETKKEKSNKIEKLKEKKQKEEAKVKTPKKEDEEQKQITETEKVKIAENQAETKKDMQEDKKKITQKKEKQQDKKVEKEREEQIEEKKEEQKQTTETEKVKIAENQAETKKDMQEDKKTITQKKDKQEDKQIEKKREEQIEESKEEQKQTIETEKIKVTESQAETKKDIQEDKKKITQKKEKQQDKKIEKEKEKQIEERKEEQKQATQTEKVKVAENQAETKKDIQEDKKIITQKKDKQEDKKIEKEREEQIEERKEEQKQTIQIEKIKVEESQAETKKDMQEDKQKDKKVEKEREEQIEKRKEEIIKIDQVVQQTQNEYIKKENDEAKSNQKYKEAKKDQKLEETTRIKQKQEEKLNKEIPKSREDKDLHIKVDKYQKKQRDDEILQKREEQSKWQCAEIEKTKRNVEQRQWRSQDDEDWLRTRKEERFNRSNEYRLDTERKEQYDREKRDDNKRLHQMEMERLEKKFAVGRSKRDETDYMFRADEERLQKRSDEKRIRGDETARLLWEEGQKLRKKQEEEAIRNKQRRKEQIRESEWSRRRENESDRFLKNMLETRYKPDKSTSMFFDVDYSRDYTSRLVSGISTLSSTSRSYSWRDSLTSLSRRRIDDYWDYKLHGSSMDKYFDIGSYRRRKRRENRMIRARSTSLLKYEDYSTGDSDATIVPSTRRIRPVRRTKTEATSRINFDIYEPSLSSYAGFGQSEDLSWDKPKKPSFCTRLTNRVVGTGMRIRLTCTVLGNPEPRVYWTRDGQNLDVSDSRCRTRYENGMAYLELYDALPTDAGMYACVAENAHGISSTESTLRVYSDYKPTHSPPTFVKSIRDTYRYSDQKLILECRVRAHPPPSIFWLKDGQILQGERYKQSYLDDDVYRLEIANPNAADNGRYTCRAVNDLHTEETSHMVHVEDWRSTSRYDLKLSDETGLELTRRPRFSNLLKDYNVPAGGTIALQVEVKGVPAPEIKWLRGDRKEPIAIPKARTFTERGLHTLIVPEATESERGTYVCRAINAYGQVDTSATVDVITSSAIDGGKPAAFVSRPSKKSIDVTVGEDVSISFRVNGTPKPRVIWMKGLTDITDGPRSYKESIDDYVRLTLKRAVPSDEGTYCILVKNRYGCDRSFFSIKVKQRARSLTPSPDWNSVTERDAGEQHDEDMSYVRNVPGPISSEPVAVDGGKNWLSLTWGKAERRGPAPVIAYKVDAWLLGSDGGARWIELGITPINAFDAFNLRPGGEYKFRVTPRNRYGWGEPVTMTNSVLVSESTDLPEFTKILPGQLKALEGTSIRLECEIHGDPKVDVRWYHETTEIDSRSDSRFAIYYNGSKCFLTIANIKENDSGRYVCEASNKIGKVSSFARVLVVNDPRIIEADTKLRTSLRIEPKDKPPQFTMRIRDRRVQTTYPIRLTCQVIGHPAPEIIWYKNEEKISQDDRHIFWDDDSNFHTLEITHSTLDDSGCYMVTAKNVNGSVSCRCTLVVDKGIRAYVAPEFLRGLDAAYTVHSGRELRMSAQLEAYPSVGVVWHRDGIRLRPNRRALMTLSHDGTVQFSLANITARDAGVYSCTATNVVGHTETSTRVAVIEDAIPDQSSINESSNIISVSPDIPYSKEPLFVTKPLSTEAVEGDTVIIVCEVVGDPKPEVIWLRDFLKPDYYKDAPHFRLVGAGPQYRLEIPYAKLDFTGTYSVIARNCHGEAKAVISLQIYAKGQGKEEQTQKSHGKVMTLPIIKRELRDLRCCDGDAVSLECKVYATPEPPLIRWERGGKIISMMGDFAAEFDGETARLSIQHVYPEDEGEYTCVAYNDLGKAYTSACLVVDVPEGKESTLSQRLTRPVGLLSAGSTPRSTPRSTPIRSLSPAVSHGREFRSPQVLPRGGTSSRRPKVCPPKFYAVPHNRLVQEGETVRFQCAVVGHPAPWVRWDKNGTIVTPSARISIKERDDVKILEIVDVMREDAGLYRVTAENDFGRIEASARLEVINRYESTSRTIRTRSASPRTYPSFDRSLLSTTSRISERLQLECRIRGTPSITPTWYRNGRPLERSARIKRYFDGTTAKIEISKVKASDAGEYTCVATNVLGSTKSSCQVTVLDPRDSSIADKNAPRFLRSLPEESIVMENHCHEFQAGVTGTPPFTITWFKDGRELPDNDYYKYVIYGDGGVALRLSQVRPQDAGEYTCVVRNDFGVASCNSLFAVQDYKDAPKLALQFTKTPLSVIAVKGGTACFCARMQCEKTMELVWTINGKDARENAKCKIERDGNVSILRICDISSRETGEIRCTVSVNGKGPSISCTAKLQLQRSLHDSIDRSLPSVSVMTKPEDIQSHPQAKLSLTNNNNTGMSEKITELSLLKRQRGREESPTRIRSSSFPRRIVSCTKNISPLPARKRILNNASADNRKSRFENNLSQKITKNLDSNAKMSNDLKLSSSSNEINEVDISIKLLSSKKPEQFHQDTNVVSNEECAKSLVEELMKATIIKDPADIAVFRGNSAVVAVTYQGRPEPTVKWLRVNRELQPDEKIKIISGNGTSCLTLDDVTYDHAGKYEVSVENLLGKERRFFSLAVEGPPEPIADKPSVNLSTGQATIVWRSPPYDGGRTVIGYTVEAKHAGESTWMVIAESCHSLSHTVSSAETNLVIPGESYRFRVRAENIHGLSDPSMESDSVRIPKEGETMLQEEEEDEFEPSFAARIVEPEEGKLFGERYSVLEELGKGRYGIVKKVIEQETSMSFAAKFVKTIKAKDREQVREEIKIMNLLRHPKLLLLAAAYENPRETILITEYISGGELFERVVADDFTLTERDSILFMRQICQGVEYMHKNKIVHLDLKPENIMCRTRTSHQIKLIDFGLAQTLKSDTPIRVLFGTPEFIPPEIISYEPIGTESDMWSVGVICYVLLTGLSPFMGDNDAETFANITRADYDLEDEAFDAISNNAKDFISGLLIKRKELRMSATECLEHPWIAQHVATMSRIVLPTEKLKKFIIRRKWQKTGNAIRALGRMAILSANSRLSPTATAESSPTLEQRFDMQYSDDRVKSIRTAIDEDTEHVTDAKENSAETESWTHPTYEVIEINTELEETPTKEESLSDLSNQVEEKTSKLHIKLIPKIKDVTTRLEILASKENEKSDKELIEKSSQMDTIPKSQALHRVFRGDSRDSGIGDCGSNQMTSSLQMDELEIGSTIVEEVDHETHNRESKQTFRKEENRQSSTRITHVANLSQDQKNPLHDSGIIASNDKVVAKSDMTKASCETNPVRKVADESTNARILSGRNHDRFLPTGKVSRTAKIFERESGTSKSDNSQVPQRAYPAALITGKPHNERIQKAFAFWNK